MSKLTKLYDKPRTFSDELEDLFWNTAKNTFFKGAWSPAVDIEERDNQIRVSMDIPGILEPEKDIEVTLENGILVIKGSRRMEKDERTGSYYRTERSYGSFARTFTVPKSVKPDGLNAEYKNGVLTVTLQKPEDYKPQKVDIKVIT